jgi:hypothetical protein
MNKSENNHYHPSYEDIAAFVDESLGEIDEARIRVHLDCCERCVETYRYAVRFTGMHAGVSVDDSPGREAIRAAKAVAGRQYRRHNFERRGRRKWLAGLTPAGRRMVAFALVAVFVAVVLWLRPMAPGFDPHSDSLAPVTQALVSASSRQPLVIPGVESEIGPGPAPVRSGPITLSTSLDRSLTELATRFTDNSLSGAETRWLIAGYLATGQIENARAFIEDARTRRPEDRDLVVLEGILAYSDNDLRRSAELFESVLRENDRHPTALFNLAVVMQETGEQDRARELFERVERLVPDTPLAARAKLSLSQLP